MALNLTPPDISEAETRGLPSSASVEQAAMPSIT